MRIRVNKAFQTTKVSSGDQKVRAEQSGQAWSTTQSNSTEAVSSASKQKCHGSAFPKSRNQNRQWNRRGANNDRKSSKYDTTAPAVGLKYEEKEKYDTIAPAVGLKYCERQSESVRVIVRSNNLGALKARVVIQLGEVSHEQSVSTERATVKSEVELLTKPAAGISGKTSNNKSKKAGPNSQGPQKSNFKSQGKPFGRNNKKNKGYKSPNSEKGNSIPVRSYTPFTEAQKRNFTKLLKETLLSDC